MLEASSGGETRRAGADYDGAMEVRSGWLSVLRPHGDAVAWDGVGRHLGGDRSVGRLTDRMQEAKPNGTLTEKKDGWSCSGNSKLESFRGVALVVVH